MCGFREKERERDAISIRTLFSYHIENKAEVLNTLTKIINTKLLFLPPDLKLFLCTQKAYFSQIFFTKLSKSVLVAAFLSTYFYAHFRISHKKTLDGNGKMHINKKNAHKKHMRTFE